VSLPIQTQPFVVLTELEGLQSMLETNETLTNLELFIEGLMTEADVQHLADGLSVNKSLTTLALSSISTEFSPIYKALQHKMNLEVLHICDYEVSKHTAESGHTDLREALKSIVCLRNLSLIGVGDNEVRHIADGLINHPSLEVVLLVNDIYSVLKTQIPCVSCLLRALHSCPALKAIFVSSGLTACCSWVQDDAMNGHWDVRHDAGSESEIGDLTASLLQERFLVLDFFSHLRPGPFVTDPFKCIDAPGLPNTRLIVESLCKNLVPHYPFLKNCGLQCLSSMVIVFLLSLSLSQCNMVNPEAWIRPGCQWSGSQ